MYKRFRTHGFDNKNNLKDEVDSCEPIQVTRVVTLNAFEHVKNWFLGFFFNFFKIFSKTFYVRISMFWHFLGVFNIIFDEKLPSNDHRNIVEWIGEFLKNPNISCQVTTQSDNFFGSGFWKFDQISTFLHRYSD